MPIGHFAEPTEDEEARELALLVIQLHQAGASLPEIVRAVALWLARRAAPA